MATPPDVGIFDVLCSYLPVFQIIFSISVALLVANAFVFRFIGDPASNIVSQLNFLLLGVTSLATLSLLVICKRYHT
ncbi:MAG: hypothetical protein ABEH88_03155 [Halobacteriales archaeon]